MATTVLQDDQITELSKDGFGNYIASYVGNETGLLFLKIDWSSRHIPPTNIKITALRTVAVVNFKLLARPGFIYTPSLISTETASGTNHISIPFQLIKNVATVPLGGIHVEIRNVTGTTIFLTENIGIL